MQCVILAGGRGTRVASYTATLPKALIPVAGKPFIDYQLAWLLSQGVDDVVLSIGYKGDLIRKHLEHHAPQGMRVRFSEDGKDLQGTAGALRQAFHNQLLAEFFFVMYGDSAVDLSLPKAAQFFLNTHQPALMTVFHNRGEYDSSNVTRLSDGRWRYKKNPPPSMQCTYIDYGVLAFKRSVFVERVPATGPYDLAPVLETLSNEDQLAIFEVDKRFYEIGSYQGIADFQEKIKANQAL